MPNLLSKRRSLLDLLSTPSADPDPRPKTSSLAPDRPRWDDERPRSEYGFPKSRLSHEVSRDELPEPKDSHDAASTRSKRFSMMRFRNYSESQLSVRAREAERREREDTPPVPAVPATNAVPAIVKTAPTMDHVGFQEPEPREEEDTQERERRVRPSLFKRSMSKGRSPSRREPRKSTEEKRSEKKVSSLRWRKLQGRSTGLEDLQRMAAAQVATNQGAPPAYGDDANSALALPVSGHRFSESTRSDGTASNDSSEQIYGATTTTTHTVSTHTTFFKLARRNKNRNSLFPLPVKIHPPGEHSQNDGPPTPRASTGALSTRDDEDPSNGDAKKVLQRRHTETSPTKSTSLSTNAALARSALSFAEPGGMSIMRNDSQRSRASSNNSPLQPPRRLGMRDRASTTSSFGRSSHDMGTPPPLPGSGRNSTSTTGRTSLGGLLNLSRFRQSSDPHSPRNGSPGARSKSNSFAMSREALVVPEREEGDTPIKYLERLEAAVARSMIAGILSKSADPFAQAVLRSYTRAFPFFGEPIDMSLRKFLLEAELPKETQQVDRVIQAFADRYHECNPGIFVSSDQAYVIAFSLMMLHTDAFNKNNKRKMQKQDYIRNTSGQQVSDDVLACFYDNICYTPFVHYEEEMDINGEKVLPFKPKKKERVKAAVNETAKKPITGPVDPYNLLIDSKLDLIRPAIRETITLDDPYGYKQSHANLDPHYLQRAFTHTGTLQIISQRSRPTAYEGQLTNNEPPVSLMEMQPGIIDIKITKVGTLWRKSAKKKKTRSPWQEWGAILTGSQLYMFKNHHWAKGLVNQFNSAQERGRPRTPVTFKPPLQEFKPDALIRTDNAVALVDSTYTRHKHAFTFIGPGGYDEVLLADNEAELNDWLALINYAAAFRSAGVRIRGMVGGAEEDGRTRDVRRLESTQSARTAQSTHSMSTTDSELNQKRVLSPQLQKQVMVARRQIMVQKVGEAAKEINEAGKELEDLLRNARHLLLLAPIAPKTREDMIHAAARADANLKWMRRDIWRLKCYKDILAMDVQQDGVSAHQVEALAEQHVEVPESVGKKIWPIGLARLTSRAGVSKSPPLSPTSSNPLAPRPTTTGSLEAYTNDVFRTPLESTSSQQTSEWTLPPLQLDVQLPQEPHRVSVSSGPLSTSSHDGRNSVSQSSTLSDAQANSLDERSDTATPRPRAPSSVQMDADIQLLARATMTPDPVSASARANMNMDGAAPAPTTNTPDSATKSRSATVRRSLQKTVRNESHRDHNTSSSVRKHRKGKESDSTVRSATGLSATTLKDGSAGAPETAVEDGTPGLKREQGRFILHGKQASVVHTGTHHASDWAGDRMKARREAWRQGSGSTAGTHTAASISGGEGSRTPGRSPVLEQGSHGNGNGNGWGMGSREVEFGIVSRHGSDAFANGGGRDEWFDAVGEHTSPKTAKTAKTLQAPAHRDGKAGEEEEIVSWPLTTPGRTVPASEPASYISDDNYVLLDGGKSHDQQQLEDDDDISPTRKPSKRLTAIGPSKPTLSNRTPPQTQAQAGAQASDDEDDDEEHYATPTSDSDSGDEPKEQGERYGRMGYAGERSSVVVE